MRQNLATIAIVAFLLTAKIIGVQPVDAVLHAIGAWVGEQIDHPT
jgi:hypothetical protein